MTAELSIVVPTIKLFAILCFCMDPYQHLSYISAYKYLEVIKTLNTKIFEIFDRRLYELNIKRKTIILNLPARKFFASNPPTLLYAILNRVMDQIVMGNSSAICANFYASFTMSDKTNA